MKSYSQVGQEQWVRNYLKDKRNGFFVDVGAYDGIESSNSYYLEHELGWKGVCIESHPSYYQKLIQVRSVDCVNKAVLPQKGYAYFRGIETFYANGPHPGTVESDTLDSILESVSAPRDIDYISFDIEGHEFSVLEKFDFDKWNVNLMTIEHNLYCKGPTHKNLIFELLISKGYTRMVDNVHCPTGPYEDWYAKYPAL